MPGGEPLVPVRLQFPAAVPAIAQELVYGYVNDPFVSAVEPSEPMSATSSEPPKTASASCDGVAGLWPTVPYTPCAAEKLPEALRATTALAVLAGVGHVQDAPTPLAGALMA